MIRAHGGLGTAVATLVRQDHEQHPALGDGTTALGRTYRVTRLVGLAFSVPWLAGLTISLCSQPDGVRSVVIGAAALVAVVVAVVAAALRPSMDPRTLMLVLAVTAWVSSLNATVDGLTDTYPLVLSWTDMATAVMGLVAVSLRTAAVGIVGVSLLQGATTFAVLSGDLAGSSWRIAAAFVVYALGVGFATAAMAYALRRGSRRLDRAADELKVASATNRAARAHADESHRFARLLHDTVINTMSAVRRGLPEASQSAIGERCRSDLEALSRGAVGTSSDVAAFALARARQLGLTATIHGPSPALPPAMADEVNAMVGECLTNVAKHAGVSSVAVEIAESRRTVAIRIIDRGAGWDGSVPEAGGIAESVLRRAEEIGWGAQVRTARGRGTVVTLTHDRAEPDESPPVLIRSESRLTVFLIGASLLVTAGILTVLPLGEYPVRWSVVGLIVAASGVVGAWFASGHQFPLSEPAAALLAVATLPVFYLPAGGVEGCMRVGWPWWGPIATAIMFAPLILLGRSTRWVVIALVMQALTLVGMLARFNGQACSSDLAARAMVQLAVVGGLYLLRHRLIATLEAVGGFLTLTHDTLDAAGRAECHQRMWQDRIGRTVWSARELLADLAAGRVSATDPVVRRRAAAEEAHLRSQILLPPALAGLGDQISASLAGCHDRGARVQVHVSGPVCSPVAGDDRVVGDLLRRQLATVARGQEARLTLIGDENRATLTCVTPGSCPDADRTTATMRSSVERIDGQSLLEIDWIPVGREPVVAPKPSEIRVRAATG